MDTHSLSASVRGFGEHFLKGNTMKGVLTPEWVNNQAFSLVLNEQCLAVPSQMLEDVFQTLHPLCFYQ